MENDFLEVATLGRSVGLKGYVKLYNKSDFPEQFKKNAKFFDKDGKEFILKDFNKINSSALFFGFEDIELAKELTNKILYTTKELTRKTCKLKKDEFFYFDILSLAVIEDDEELGVVVDIQDISKDRLLEVKTDKILVDAGLPKTFFIPYIDNFILNVDLSQKTIYVKNSRAILENS
ncbi:ribosome maturation factor RimM [Campylobacter pinnipediorum]|uniref:ribosome maturation factor RimM n=1 Tax=Campylobacter pinnipediorum TaxID=1965231 RepID=UPI00084DB5AF|nr:ribosome maturation factor RimM [Campylobacter pinnipediorum]